MVSIRSFDEKSYTSVFMLDEFTLKAVVAEQWPYFLDETS